MEFSQAEDEVAERLVLREALRVASIAIKWKPLVVTSDKYPHWEMSSVHAAVAVQVFCVALEFEPAFITVRDHSSHAVKGMATRNICQLRSGAQIRRYERWEASTQHDCNCFRFRAH